MRRLVPSLIETPKRGINADPRLSFNFGYAHWVRLGADLDMNVRHWVVRHAGLFEWIYKTFEPVIVWLHPVWKKIGYQRVEKPVVVVEKAVKGLLFNCQMCGQCVLSSTGMSCPMNCPKNLRNGPCGGVRANGHCEVKPEMRCVWVEAWEGSRRMRDGDKIRTVQKPVDFRLKGSSSWLRVVRQTAGEEPPAGGQQA